MQRYKHILEFWFGNTEKSAPPATDKPKLWFLKKDETDHEIREKFSGDLEKVKNGEYRDWSNDADKSLALIILTDQFSRNIYRNRPESFSFDDIALHTALKAIEKGFDRYFYPLKRFFFYLPFEHSENLEMQKKCVSFFQELIDSSPSDQKKQYADLKEYADKHYQIIERFGRFPHRNKILGRESSPAETEFLKQPGSSF